MRSHDRGMSAGECAEEEPATCSIVVPWDVAPKYAHANMEALRLRSAIVPYLYTAAYHAHKSGLWFTAPLYYQWPELEGAYETSSPRPDPASKYEPQYSLGPDIWAAPVVKPSNSTDGLARMKLWVPPGLWVGMSGGQVVKGRDDGSSSVSVVAELNDIPLFARAGSIIPSIPVRPGNTVGLAMKPYDELIWNVYLATGGPMSGSGVVYEDDGMSTAYHDRDSYTLTTATYNISETSNVKDEVSMEARSLQVERSRAKKIAFTVTPSGHCEKLPTARATTIRFINSLPPESVVVNGLAIAYARFGGQATWRYESTDSAVTVELPLSQVAEGLQVELIVRQYGNEAALLDGIGFKIQRAISAKAALDEIRKTPGSRTGQDKLPGSILLAASAGSRLEYLASPSSRTEFNNLLAAFPTYLDNALGEVKSLAGDDDAANARVARAALLLLSAAES